MVCVSSSGCGNGYYYKRRQLGRFLHGLHVGFGLLLESDRYSFTSWFITWVCECIGVLGFMLWKVYLLRDTLGADSSIWVLRLSRRLGISFPNMRIFNTLTNVQFLSFQTIPIFSNRASVSVVLHSACWFSHYPVYCLSVLPVPAGCNKAMKSLFHFFSVDLLEGCKCNIAIQCEICGLFLSPTVRLWIHLFWTGLLVWCLSPIVHTLGLKNPKSPILLFLPGHLDVSFHFSYFCWWCSALYHCAWMVRKRNSWPTFSVQPFCRWLVMWFWTFRPFCLSSSARRQLPAAQVPLEASCL